MGEYIIPAGPAGRKYITLVPIRAEFEQTREGYFLRCNPIEGLGSSFEVFGFTLEKAGELMRKMIALEYDTYHAGDSKRPGRERELAKIFKRIE